MLRVGWRIENQERYGVRPVTNKDLLSRLYPGRRCTEWVIQRGLRVGEKRSVADEGDALLRVLALPPCKRPKGELCLERVQNAGTGLDALWMALPALRDVQSTPLPPL
ncbi:MAG: hypothetical protein EB075_14315 [Bacteroidetes bacterium]|nr:hypothetical protein [Bacteroidota bacterium]